jgi:hypothetical protein
MLLCWHLVVQWKINTASGKLRVSCINFRDTWPIYDFFINRHYGKTGCPASLITAAAGTVAATFANSLTTGWPTE